jgi:hypothetical protein
MSYVKAPTYKSLIQYDARTKRFLFNEDWMRWFTGLPHNGSLPVVPTYQSPVLIEEATGKKSINPAWADWLLKLVGVVAAGVKYIPAPTHTQIIDFRPETNEAKLNQVWVDWFTRLPI